MFFISGAMLSQGISYLVLCSVVVYCSIFWVPCGCSHFVSSWFTFSVLGHVCVEDELPSLFLLWCCWFFRSERGTAALLLPLSNTMVPS